MPSEATMNTREYNFWFVFQRAEDVPGEWVGHCLELDVVSQGKSLKHAAEMLAEACFITVCDDLIAQKDPLCRRAPDEFWKALYKIIDHGEKVDFSSLDETKVHSSACQVQTKFVMIPAHAPQVEPMQPTIPLAWRELPEPQVCSC